MDDLFISPERKYSKIVGTGVQYLPGHSEPLVDLIVNKYLPNFNDNIVDLGGGGFRFAFPVASLGRKITVVDLDSSVLDIDHIINKVMQRAVIEKTQLNLLKQKIEIVNNDIFNFLESTKKKYSLITIFRVIHFFDSKELEYLFNLISKRLSKTGKLVASGFTQFNEDNITDNEVFVNTIPVNENKFYRVFNGSSTANEIQKNQNLSQFVHFFSPEYLNNFAIKNHLKLISYNLPSTRIVRGYIFTKY